MNDYIDREYLVDHIHACMENDRLMQTATKEEILQMVAGVPSAEPKTGEWILTPMLSDNYRYECSNCMGHHRERHDFCPSCGADMRGGEHE